jgi:tripartite-type tricarboxylate transporter receptor subunit TctC
MQDLLGGRLDLMFDLAADALPQLRVGSVKAYAVMAPNRLAAEPELPTVDELGVPGLHVSLWNALWTPRGVPGDVIGRLNAAVVDTLADPSVRQRLADLGHDIFPRRQQTPEALGRYQKAEIDKWWPIIKAAGIKGE